MASALKILLCEYAGTTIFLFVGLSSVATTGGSLAFIPPGNLPANAFGNGIGLFATFFFFSEITGAHFNPAITFAFAIFSILRGRWEKFGWWRLILYPVAQFAAAITATLLVWVVVGTLSLPPGLGIPVIFPGVTNARAIFTEALFTTCLIFSYLWTDISKDTIFTSIMNIAKSRALSPEIISMLEKLGGTLISFLRALVIGFFYIVFVFAAAPVTGANFNPFRYLAPAIITNNYAGWPILVFSPLLGAAFALIITVILQVLMPSKREGTSSTAKISRKEKKTRV